LERRERQRRERKVMRQLEKQQKKLQANGVDVTMEALRTEYEAKKNGNEADDFLIDVVGDDDDYDDDEDDDDDDDDDYLLQVPSQQVSSPQHSSSQVSSPSLKSVSVGVGGGAKKSSFSIDSLLSTVTSRY
jgi:hypothetical protein